MMLSKLLIYIESLIIEGYYRVFLKNKFLLGRSIHINKRPIIVIKNGGKIYIGNNVTLNSNNSGYHINMFSKVKLMADRRNSEICIGDGTRIHGSCLHAYSKISVGKNCLIAANCQIIDGNGHNISFEDVSNRINTIGSAKQIIIEDNVWIGANSIILPGVTIGHGSIVSAGSVVFDDVPPMSIARGNPAIVVKNYDNA